MPRNGTTLPDLGRVEGLVTTTVDSPIGDLVLVAGPEGLKAVLWPGEEEATVDVVDIGDPDADRAANHVLSRTVDQLTEYFTGDRLTFDIPLDPVGTAFQQAAWMALRDIPYGSTITYGEQARRMGDARKARAVGAANGRNPISIIVPCHRVVGSDGTLTGYAGGTDIKAWLLHHERVNTSQELPLESVAVPVRGTHR